MEYIYSLYDPQTNKLLHQGTPEQLVERGLVQGNFPENKRSYRTRLTLTASGQELVAKIYQKVDAAMIGGSSGLTEAQRENLYAAMEIIINNLSRYIAAREE